MDTQQLIELQTKRKEQFKLIIGSTSEKSEQNLSRTKIAEKLVSLDNIYKEFLATHNDILKYGKPDIPYIIMRSGEKVLEFMKSSIISLRKNALVLQQDVDLMDITLGTGYFDQQTNLDQTINLGNGGQLPTSNLETNVGNDVPSLLNSGNNLTSTSGGSSSADSQNALVRKLQYKVQKLLESIDSIQLELSSEMVWTNQLFEVKNKYLFDQWNVIALLEEDIIMTLDKHVRIDWTKSAFERMNDVIKRMISKIQPTCVATSTEQRRHGKLPDLKIPVFNGDYRKWRNFKDIFDTMIHNRQEMPTIEKMEYLKVYVEGEPNKLISNYMLSSENYTAAYDVLVKRYDNKRKLFTIYVDNMVKPIGKYASADAVKELHDGITEGMTSIKNLGIDNTSWGPLIVHLAIGGLDHESRALFEARYNEQDNDIPALDDFLKFLESRYKTLEILDPMRTTSTSKVKANNGSEKRTQITIDSKTSCLKCEGDHRLYMCPKYLSLSPKSRFKFAKTLDLCINCLFKHKDKQPCESKRTCKQCNKPHHTLLHFIDKKSEDSPTPKTANVGKEVKYAGLNTEEVLATAQIQVRDVRGLPVTIRVLIDTGAQANFITEGLAQKLRLKRIPYTTEITGIGKIKAHCVKHAVELNMEPVFPSEFDVDVVALILGKDVTSTTPENYISEKLPDSWPTLQLADPSFRNPGAIDMILGISFFTRILLPEIHRSENSNLIAVKSNIGWLILGETTRKRNSYISIRSMICVKSTSEDISRFWELEDIPEGVHISSDDQYCENHYASTHKRLDDGRYVVMIPFKENVQHLQVDPQTSRKQALCRFYHLEEKFKRNPSYAEQYQKFIEEYIRLGHMRQVQHNKNNTDFFYLPHHAVLKPESSSTKLRVVFDASAKTRGSHSLNEWMLAGPRLQDDLATILLRWRFHKYVISADIEKMYRQILINQEHCRYQRIFWRSHPNEELKEFELTTVTYGTTAAPYLAIKTLQQLAKDDQHKFPVAANIALNDFYVDDVLTGADSVEKCILLQTELQHLMRGGGFTLRKWSSNSEDILKTLHPDDISKEIVSLQDFEEKSMKTLGLLWKPREDEFTFKVIGKSFSEMKKTKRIMCSDISRIFDPLGWLSPFTIATKALFQKTWKLPLEWDSVLPDDIIYEWSHLRKNINALEDIRIPRWINTCNQSIVELHGFCDSSKIAYAAVIYAKVTSPSGETSLNLLMAKTKVAPVKQELTIPRLELCGALLLSKLYSYVVKSFKWDDKKFVAWCDSTIALSWIKGEPSRWNVFVANRVANIQELTKNCQWRYISTDENPADCASRGVSIDQLTHHELWWTGPKWLHHDEHDWPSNTTHHVTTEEIPEAKRVKATIATTIPTDNIESITLRFSSYNKLRSCIAYCLRFVNNCQSTSKISGSLSTIELAYAEKVIIRQVQRIYYNEEIVNLRRKLKLKNTNGILSLTPFLDDDDILRVTGRLQNAAISYDEKHPIILPHSAYVSRLIVREAHLKCHHGLNSLTELVIRKKFWIVKCKNLVKTIIFRCVVCRRRNPKMENQLMGQLPISRVTLNNPFYHTGVDYAGPFEVKPWRGRCNKAYKSYISVFVCMTTKAIHLELASDLTAESFLAAYRRFSYRRGPCLNLYSDCGTNFVGAKNIMDKNLQLFQKEWKQKVSTLAVTGVVWHFNPPSNPHAGGLWEAAVKSVKQLLLKYLGNTLLTYEEFNTLLVQIEGCLNSRPLGVIRDVPEDHVLLTPNHFLTGTSIFTQPEPEEELVSLSARWRYVQKLRDQTMAEFKTRFIHQLQHRRKWNEVKDNMKIGDVVIVEDHRVPQHKYPIGIVTDVHPGDDGLTRVVTVKMESGRLFKRSISKLCSLPVLTDVDDPIYKASTAQDQPVSEKVTKPVSAKKLEQKRYNLRPRSAKTSKLATYLGVLLALFTLSTADIVPTIVERFDHNSGLVFAKLGDMRVSTSSWTMVMYYNMSSFFAELNYIETSSKLFYERCQRRGPLATYCAATFSDIQQQLIEINEDNDILMDMNHVIDNNLHIERSRRAVMSLLPFVGSLSRAAFGTLDEQYARDLERVIYDMQNDDQTMMGLIKNQTSVMETFLQQARITEERSKQQLEWITSNLENMENIIHNMAADNNINIQLQFIATHIISRTQHLFSIQSAIIQAITNAHHGNLRAILHPGTFKKQLKLMKSSLPAELIIPVTSENLIKLYNLLTVKTRVSENMIIFHFELPLVASRQYEVFKVIPLPIRREEHIVIVQPTTEYISFSLNREKFIPVSATELAECSHLDETTFLCHEHHPELKNNAESSSCEVSLFVHHKFHPTLCHTVAMETDQLWIQLPTPHKWIFYTNKPQGYSVSCGKKGGRFFKLEGEGMLTLHPSCTLEHSSFTIPSSNNIQTEHKSELYIPEVNVTTIMNKDPIITMKNKSTVLIRRTDMFNDIEHQLNDIKHKQVLKTHQVSHQLSIGSISLVSALTLVSLIYVAYLGYKKFFQTSKPIPKPRKSKEETSKSIESIIEPQKINSELPHIGCSPQQENRDHPLDDIQLS